MQKDGKGEVGAGERKGDLKVTNCSKSHGIGLVSGFGLFNQPQLYRADLRDLDLRMLFC